MADFLHRALASLRSRLAELTARAPDALGGLDRRTRMMIAAGVVVVLILYYPLGMLIYNGIDDDITLQPSPAYSVSGGSAAVSMAATLAARAADHWIANKPFFHPAAPLDNTPNFQLGMIYAVSRFALELGDYLGRVRGSSAIDANLDRAAALLRFDGTIWGIWPMASAERQYRQGAERLLAFNKDVAAGKSVYDRRADNLIAFLDRVAADLGSASAELDIRADAGGGYFDTKADDVFYNAKGKLYGYYMILTALGDDFAPVIREKQATEIWANMMNSFRTGATMDPLVVVNGRQDSMLMPSHLATLGFHLLRARTQIREMTDTLRK
jgi:hypothetical protein